MLSIITSVKNPEINMFLEKLELYRSFSERGFNLEWVIQDYDVDSVLKKYIANLSFVSYEAKTDTGIYQAWNTALLRAQGHKICFLGLDDTPSLDWIKFVSDVVITDNQAISCNVQMLDKKKFYGERINPDAGPVDLSCTQYAHPGFVFSAKIFENSKFNENYRIISDGLFYSSFGIIYIVRHFDDVGLSMNIGGISNSRTGARLRFMELFRAFFAKDLAFNRSNLIASMASFPAFIFSFLPSFVFVRLQRARWYYFSGTRV